MISVVIPVYNELASIKPLVDRLLPVLENIGRHEVIFINDGSADGSDKALDEQAAAFPERIKVLHLRRNCGKSIALDVGFAEAKGDIIVMMDADLQDQPEEIPKLLARLDEGLDAVTGWKVNRLDPVSKTVPSRFFNWMVCKLFDLDIHDLNCGLKAFRSTCLPHIALYGQLHRFLLVFLAQAGFKVGEVGIEHAPRRFGVSKYGVRRIYHGFMDIITVLFITRYRHSPLHFFGFYGTVCMLLSLPIGLWYIGWHLFAMIADKPGFSLAEHPLWLVSPFLFLIGVVFVSFGLLGELITYHMIPQRSFDQLVERRVSSAK